MRKKSCTTTGGWKEGRTDAATVAALSQVNKCEAGEPWGSLHSSWVMSLMRHGASITLHFCEQSLLKSLLMKVTHLKTLITCTSSHESQQWLNKVGWSLFLDQQVVLIFEIAYGLLKCLLEGDFVAAGITLVTSCHSVWPVGGVDIFVQWREEHANLMKYSLNIFQFLGFHWQDRDTLSSDNTVWHSDLWIKWEMHFQSQARHPHRQQTGTWYSCFAATEQTLTPVDVISEQW